MKVEIPKGKYVLAVSGGVDSMALLHLLAKKPGVELVVAHFNHNIREDSVEDEKLVRKTASKYKMVFEVGSASLNKSSEEVARQARYRFLRKVQSKYNAAKIITAHHQDDVIETAFINIIRGTDRRGLSAIVNNKTILRPLTGYPKATIVKYAQENCIEWREDSTNLDIDYLRNYVRLKLLPKMDSPQRVRLVKILEKVAKTNIKIDEQIATLSQNIGEDINRESFSALPISLGNDLLAYRLRQASIADFDAKTVSRLSTAIKTSKANSVHSIKRKSKLHVTSETASFVTP